MKTTLLFAHLVFIAFLFPGFPGLGRAATGSSLSTHGALHTEKLSHLPSASTGLRAHSDKAKIGDKEGSGEPCAFGSSCLSSFSTNSRDLPPSREASSNPQDDFVSSGRRGETDIGTSRRLGDPKRCAVSGASTSRGCDAVLASVQIGGQSSDVDTPADVNPIGVFDEADRNQDGLIDLPEALGVVNALMEEMSSPEDDFFATLPQEWLSTASFEDREFVAELIRHFDEDNDGVLRVGEFSAFLLTFYSPKSVGQMALMLLCVKHREAREENLWGPSLLATLFPQGARNGSSVVHKPGHLTFEEAKVAVHTVQQQQLGEAEQETTQYLDQLEQLERERGPSPSIDEARARKIREFHAYHALVKKGQRTRVSLADKDGDGVYDLLELLRLLDAEVQHMGACMVFASFDVNGDSRLSMEEARAVAEEATSWAVLDDNGKPLMSGKGLPTSGEKARYYREDREATPQEKKEQVCTFCWVLDANKDRYVTFDEFAYFMHNEDLVAAGLHAMLRRNTDVVQF
ncbi:EF hand domain-containing protein [Besnoitia besnoiti]|uniref:EF hand domain-containing protein n=1 Tax=Besnoitia besnoiti TaxID=94643 RepID=A0A2A9MAH8_BESBE|nr:EF hand domain-containing protein [Besnoitia besnoiti]PFH32392.1 EF hand domain-containing protein [Besnoitia besnoiti]